VTKGGIENDDFDFNQVLSECQGDHSNMLDRVIPYEGEIVDNLILHLINNHDEASHEANVILNEINIRFEEQKVKYVRIRKDVRRKT
jgi:hypothetical protein